MELAKIESILEAYFEGNTSLEQEAMLRSYFKGQEVAPHLLPYKAMFDGFEIARAEVSQKELSFPKSKQKMRFWKYGIAATAVAAFGIASLLFSGSSGYTVEEQEALAALNKTKETMLLLSQNLNKGTEGLVALEQFTEARNKVLK